MPSKTQNIVMYILAIVTLGLAVTVFNLYRNYSDLKAVYENQPSIVVFDWSEIANIPDTEKQLAYVKEAKGLVEELALNNAVVLDSRYINAAPNGVTIGMSTIKQRYENKK